MSTISQSFISHKNMSDAKVEEKIGRASCRERVSPYV